MFNRNSTIGELSGLFDNMRNSIPTLGPYDECDKCTYKKFVDEVRNRAKEFSDSYKEFTGRIEGKKENGSEKR